MFALTPNRLLDNLCIIATIIEVLYNYWCLKNNRKGTNYVFFVVFILLFSLFYRPEDGDFWNYLQVYQNGPSQNNSLEYVYNWLMDIIPNNFILWRIVIWLPAAILLAISFKKMEIPSNIATVFFLMFGLVNAYYYTRNVLGSSVLYFAIVLYYSNTKKKNNILTLLIALSLALFSWQLHKSMSLYIGLALLSVLLPINKKTIGISLVAFPLIYSVIYMLSLNVLQLDIWLNENAGMGYLEKENNLFANWKGVIQLIIKYAPIIYFYIIAFKTPIPNTSNFYKLYKTFLLLGFLVFYLSFLFLGQGSASLQGRLYKSSMIPFAFTCCLYFKDNLESKQFRVFTTLILINYAFTLFIDLATSL